MKVAVIGGDSGNPAHFEALDKELEQLIVSSGRYLFTVVGGFCGVMEPPFPLSYTWSQERGLPYSTKQYQNIGKAIQGICIEADYAIFLNDGSEFIDRFIKAFRNTGKHGSVINI